MAMIRLTFRVVADPSSSRETLDARLHHKIRSVFKLRPEVVFLSEGESRKRRNGFEI